MYTHLKVYRSTQNHFLSRFNDVRPSVRPSGCPCKPCVQNAGRIFKDILMKFGTELWFGTGTIPIENG